MTQSRLKRVLVPLDGSSQASAALKEALVLFSRADVCVLHVIQVTKVAGDETKSGYELAVEEGEKIRKAAEETATEHGRAIETELTEGNAAKTIVKYAEKNDIDHIVMGSRSQSGLKQTVLGSVATAVIRQSPSPVTVVSERSEDPAERTEINRVLVPIDGSAEGTAALRYAVETFPTAVFTAAYVVDTMTEYSESYKRSHRQTERQQKGARNKTDQIFETVTELSNEYNVDCSPLALTGAVPDAIISCAEDIDVEHIVIGSRNRAHLTKAALGSVSEATVRRSSVPITVVRHSSAG